MANQKPILQRRHWAATENDRRRSKVQTKSFCDVTSSTPKASTERAYSPRVTEALKHLDDIKDISYYKGTPKRLVSVTRLKESVQWLAFRPECVVRNNIRCEHGVRVTDHDSNLSKMPGDNSDGEFGLESDDCDGDSTCSKNDDSEERNSVLPAILDKRNRRPRVKVPCRQLSNYEWCVEWLFKLCNHPCTTLPLL